MGCPVNEASFPLLAADDGIMTSLLRLTGDSIVSEPFDLSVTLLTVVLEAYEDLNGLLVC